MTKKVCDELEKTLRAQRHQFINHIQVVHALIQMGRTEKALAYIEDIAKDPRLLTDPLRFHQEKRTCRRQVKTGM